MTALHATSPSPSPDFLQFKPRQVIPDESAGYLWCIEQGVVRTVTWDDEGDLVTLGLWGVGDCLGQRFTSMAPFQMESVSDVQVRAVPVSSQDLGFVVRSHIRFMEDLFCINSYKPAPQRLLHFLNWLGHRFGHPVEQGQLLDIGLTHQLIAELTGINRITATRLLKELEREGQLIQLPKQRIILLSTGMGRALG